MASIWPQRDKSTFLPFVGSKTAATRFHTLNGAGTARNHIKGRGPRGRMLVSILEWAERMGIISITNEAISRLGVGQSVIKQMEHAVYMFMKNSYQKPARLHLGDGTFILSKEGATQVKVTTWQCLCIPWQRESSLNS